MTAARRKHGYRARAALIAAGLEMALARRRIVGGARVAPSVFVIGAQKAGSTLLFDYLARHPAIAAPIVKEVHYFDVAAHRGLGWYVAHFPAREAGDERRGLDATPYYLFHPAVADRIHGYVPDAKLIAVLRDPVARAWSHYWHEWTRGYETLDWETAFAAEAQRLPDPHARVGTGKAALAHQHFSYVARSEYDLQLDRWRARFPGESLLILKSEALFAEPERTMRRVTDFLGIAPLTGVDMRARNTGAYEAMPDAARRWLGDRLAPTAARLASVYGEDFRW